MEKIKNTIEELITRSGFDIDEIKFCEEAEGLWCQIRTKDSALMIGPSGETLSALNHLVYRLIENQKLENPPMVFIDVNDYKKKQIENLKTKAHMMAERARFFKSSIEIEPMSAGERRIIHQYLDGQPDIKTESTGFGRDRRVVIKYVPKDSTIV